MKSRKKLMLLFAAGSLVFSASAEMMDRPVGIKIGQRMTLKPYVAVSASYDSNVDRSKNGTDDVVWIVNPSLSLEYKADSWILMANAFYQYNSYSKKVHRTVQSGHSFGQSVVFDWNSSGRGEKGWSLMISENFQQVNHTEDFTLSDGRNYGRDRREFRASGAVQRRFTDDLHMNVNTGYYWLDYDNENNASYGLYGWDRYTIGTEIGYATSKWTDFLISGGYQHFTQDNVKNSYYNNKGRVLSSESEGFSIQGGIGSHATERISYRLLGGWSTFRFAEGDGEASNGFTYTVAGEWKISDTWRTMCLATSYYQPTEREFGSSQRVDAFSWGIAHTMVRGKLYASFDTMYRRETREYSGSGVYDYDLDIMSFKLGLNYILNRYVTVFFNGEYCNSMSATESSYGEYYDYDRFRGTLGLKFTY